MENATDKFEWNVRTVKGDLTYLMEKTQDANAADKADLVAAATGGKVTIETKRVPQGGAGDGDAAVGSAKFVKKPLIEITGNKTVSFRI
jgi:hypothetical protein